MDSRHSILVQKSLRKFEGTAEEVFIPRSKKGVPDITWPGDNDDLAVDRQVQDWVARFCDDVAGLKQTVQDLGDQVDKADSFVEQLRSCAFDVPVMSKHLENLQELIDHMSTTYEHSQMAQWVMPSLP